jgi:hypothetical protein
VACKGIKLINAKSLIDGSSMKEDFHHNRNFSEIQEVLCAVSSPWKSEACLISYDDNVRVYAFTIQNSGNNVNVASNSLFIDAIPELLRVIQTGSGNRDQFPIFGFNQISRSPNIAMIGESDPMGHSNFEGRP